MSVVYLISRDHKPCIPGDDDHRVSISCGSEFLLKVGVTFNLFEKGFDLLFGNAGPGVTKDCSNRLMQ